MSTQESADREDEQARIALPEELVMRWPFGPIFFLQQLMGFVRDRCPNPEEVLPAVELHLANGDTLKVCHIIGIAPRWVALAVYETEKTATGPPPMRTELVPYDLVSRVTVRSSRRELARLGFDLGKSPTILTPPPREPLSPEDALRAAAGHPGQDVPERGEQMSPPRVPQG